MQFLDDEQSSLGGRRTQRELDLTPLINIIFLILIFFMLTAAIAPDDAAIKPVLSQSGEALPETTTYRISLDSTGAVYFEGQLLDDNALTPQLLTIVQSEDSVMLSIKADATLDASRLLEVLSLATDAGIESVALMTIRR